MHISVVCVLCEGVSTDLEQHKVHIGEKHKYVNDRVVYYKEEGNRNNKGYANRSEYSVDAVS